MAALELPIEVEKRLATLGAAGDAWRSALPELIAQLEVRWRLQLGNPLRGGSEALVALAEASDGSPAVLKLGVPGDTGFEREVATLRAADGRGYARVLAHDVGIRAVLLERLGTRLDLLGLASDAQMEHLCATMQLAWTTKTASLELMAGDTKARWLAAFIKRTWEELGRPCSERAIERAAAYAEDCVARHAAASCVLVHGDAHSANTLQSSAGGFRFVDPDGLLAEPACDLAVPMRSWSDELLPGDPCALGLARCERLSRLTFVPEESIWQWGYLETMSTGLHLLQLQWPDEARAMLRVADAWAAV